MAIFMDIHHVPGIKAKDAAEAHRLDILLQEEYGCKCLTYWVDEERACAFCLIEATTKEDVVTLHRKSHGLVPANIIEVDRNIVMSFLGRIYDPPEVSVSSAGLKTFVDPGFRLLLAVRVDDVAIRYNKMPQEEAQAQLTALDDTIQHCMLRFNGRKADTHGGNVILSFSSAANAVDCAKAIWRGASQQATALGLKMGITSGDPVSKSTRLFGEALQLNDYLKYVNSPQGITISASVKNLLPNPYLEDDSTPIFSLSPPREEVLVMLCTILTQNWQDPAFSITAFCKQALMSKSRLYRNAREITGLSPNSLIKAFRLDNAKEALLQKRFTIAEVSYHSGFTSPSYFTSCFKARFGLLPQTYVQLSR